LIPHKRGWLLYGKPGTGKTSFVRALAQEMDVPIFVYDISTMSNNDFLDRWENALEDTPCIVLFEDIDSVFDGRKNLSKNPGAMTFDCLLNCIDGIENTDGIFAVVTTNHIEKIDSAIGIPNGDGISTRPGRIDRAIEMKNPDEDGRRKIAKRILENYEHIEDIIQQGSNDTGAQFQERCARLALKLFWEK
jgi:SpoVK/Ycf46/Vps4 family AAA+-type ATPase